MAKLATKSKKITDEQKERQLKYKPKSKQRRNRWTSPHWFYTHSFQKMQESFIHCKSKNLKWGFVLMLITLFFELKKQTRIYTVLHIKKYIK
jgi:hypothetical protein